MLPFWAKLICVSSIHIKRLEETTHHFTSINTIDVINNIKLIIWVYFILDKKKDKSKLFCSSLTESMHVARCKIR